MATPAGIEKYKDLLINLLPKGRLWQPRSQPIFMALLKALAEELCRVEDRINDMLVEVDPRTTSELLTDFERVFALPDECTPDVQTLDERINQIVQKMTNVGGLSKTFYEFLGLQLGHVITVENRVNCVVGRATVGDSLTNYFDESLQVGETVGNQLRNVGWRFCFNTEMPATAAEILEVGEEVGQPLVLFTNPLIECTIRKLKPAQSCATFTFS